MKGGEMKGSKDRVVSMEEKPKGEGGAQAHQLNGKFTVVEWWYLGYWGNGQ